MLREKCLVAVLGLALCGGVASAVPPWAACCQKPIPPQRATECEKTATPAPETSAEKSTTPTPGTAAPKPAALPIYGPAAPKPALTPQRIATGQKPPVEKVSISKPAQGEPRPVMLMIGSTPCFWLRANDGGDAPQKRSDRVMDVFNKYLGGSKATFAVKPAGKKTGIFMNGDLALTVTPEDVKAAKAKSVLALAAMWKGILAKAFDETKATK
jgi:hypothetical protein